MIGNERIEVHWILKNQNKNKHDPHLLQLKAHWQGRKICKRLLNERVGCSAKSPNSFYDRRPTVFQVQTVAILLPLNLPHTHTKITNSFGLPLKSYLTFCILEHLMFNVSNVYIIVN